MKKLLIILCLVFFFGCASNSSVVLPRDQIHTGMTRMDVWKLYGYDANDIDSWYIPQFTKQSIAENQNGDCTRISYRYWLSDYDQEHPFLLTFESCKLPNYEAVQKEKKRRVDNFNEAAKNDPKLEKELVAFCEAYQLNTQDRDKVIELLTINTPNLLPQCMTDYKLIHIQRDEDYKSAMKRKVNN